MNPLETPGLWSAFTNPTLALTPIALSHEMLPNKLIRRSYWLDINHRTLVMVNDLKRDHLIDQVCVQEILPPEK